MLTFQSILIHKFLNIGDNVPFGIEITGEGRDREQVKRGKL